MGQEHWKPVSDMGGWYDVSSQGRVRSWINGDRYAKSWVRATEPRVLKPYLDKTGRWSISLMRPDGSKLRRQVSCLMALAFFGPRPPGDIHVAHNNGDHRDNRIENLRYDTRAGNEADKLKHGTHNRGERHPLHKLTVDRVREIRSRYASGGLYYRELATEYGVTMTCIASIITRRTWKWLD